MSEIVWGKTHCPWCELPLAGEEQSKMLDVLWDRPSREVDAYAEQFCWSVWYDEMCEKAFDSAITERMIAVLIERDALRAELAKLCESAGES